MFTVHYNATISPNHIRLTNTATGETVALASPQPFSSKHRMIADPEVAASFLGAIIREVEGRRRWLRFFPTIDVTIVGEPQEDMDREEVKRVFVKLGFVRVRVA